MLGAVLLVVLGVLTVTAHGRYAALAWKCERMDDLLCRASGCILARDSNDPEIDYHSGVLVDAIAAERVRP
jgi:hypothetical protein